MMSILLCPTAAQFHTFHPTCSVASPPLPDIIFTTIGLSPKAHIGLSRRPKKALGLRPNIRVNQ